MHMGILESKKGKFIMSLNVEYVGNYKIVEMPNGNYAVSLTNGSMGAFVTDKAGLLKFKEKYANKGDTFVSNNDSGKSEMTYEEAKKILLYGTGKWGLESARLSNEAIDVVLRTEAKWVKDHVRPAISLVNPTEIKPAIALLYPQETKPAISFLS